MDKYLLEILKDVNTIIIPGLGALTITNHDTGEIMFMSYLKHDDGKLSAYIAEKEGMEENEAKNLIAKYVREITIQLDKGDSYDMFQFGSFFKDGDDIDFKNWSDKDATPQEEKEVEKPKAEVKEKPKKEPEKKKAAPKAVVKKPVKKEEKSTSKKEEPKAEKKEEKPEKKEAPKEDNEKTEATPIIPIVKKSEEKPKKPEVKKEVPKQPETKELNILEKEEISANSEKLNKLKEEKEKQKTKKKRGAGFWMLIVLIVLIIGGGTAVGIFYDDVKQHIPFLADEPTSNVEEHEAIDEMAETLGLDEENEEVANEEESMDDAKEESSDEQEEIVEEEQPEETPVEEPEPVETPQVSSSSSGPFHLVAGAFSSEANANRLAEKLRGEGYPAKVMFGSGMHMVSVKSYATRADANAGKSEVNGVAPKAWILEWR